mgnify:FL=1
MAKYSDIKGFTVQTLASDTIASQQAGGTWASGTAMSTARDYVAGWAEDSDACLIAGGSTNATELYNGTSWTEKNDMSAPGNPMYARHPVGTTTAALAAGGGSPYQSTVEQWDGTNWTETGDLVTATAFGSNSPVGTTTAGLIAGGLISGGAFSAINQVWNGSSWSDQNELNEGRSYCAGLGTTTAALEIGGQPSGPTFGNKVEQWDGSSWTEISEFNTSRARGTAGGTTTSALFYAGTVGPSSTHTAVTEFWNGSSWTEIADLSTARTRGGGGGSLASAILAGGRPAPAVTGATEEWSAPATFNQIQQGQLFFNSTTNAFKETIVDIPGATWASGPTLGTARYFLSGVGNPSNALVFGGTLYSPNATGATEEWNGSAWSEKNDLNTGYRGRGALGVYNAAVACGGGSGSPPNVIANTETWNGTSWTEVNDLNTAKNGTINMGTATAGIVAAGETSPGVSVESWDGTNWTEVAEVNTGVFQSNGCGTQTSGIKVGGQTPPNPLTANTELWNGTSWTEVNNLNTAKRGAGMGGETSDSAIYFGGASTASQAIANTEFWNGTSWTEVADLGTGRKFLTGSVNSPVAGVIGAGGYQPSSPYTRNITEEWTADLSNKTITAS